MIVATKRRSYTPTQRKLLSILADGKPHTVAELFTCLPDDLGEATNVRSHLTGLRKRLRGEGRDIACELVCGVGYYRLVRAAEYDAN